MSSDKSAPKPEFLAAGERLAKMTPRQIGLFVQRMQETIEKLKTQISEPIAVVGMGCRFPGGADSPAKYWDLLIRGENVISEVPKDRWDIETYFDADQDARGKTYSRRGGFIDNVAHFDAELFRIPPQEATVMDPQHRLLLEVSYEALEDAGIAPRGLEGSKTGVFMGAMTHDYEDFFSLAGADSLRILGTLLNGASGRIAYALGLRGPCIALDTACSSALVSVHLACQSLREGACNVALAGGVNLNLSPTFSVYLSRAHTLSPTGQCHTFDAKADGFVCSEGGGVVVLKRLSDALANGDCVRAVMLATHVNQNGRGPNWIAPSSTAQTELLRDALARSGLQPTDIDYVEAHGLGTALGDANEVEAIGRVYGAGRTDANRLVVGSVKTNLGHLEAAGGAAGLLKLVLALERECIPKHLHFEKVNPHLDLAAIPVAFPTRAMPWPAKEARRRRGAVSAFGLSGTNGHAIVEEAPKRAAAVIASLPEYVLFLSGQSEAALQARVEQLRDHLSKQPEIALGDVCFTSNVGRDHFAHRLCLRVKDMADLRAQLAQRARGLQATAVQSRGDARRIGYHIEDTPELTDANVQALCGFLPAFKEAFETCASAMREHLGLNTAEQAEAFAFAAQYSLGALWRTWHVKPSLVMGTGRGDCVAATLAGVLSIADGARIAMARAHFVQAQGADKEQARTALLQAAKLAATGVATVPWRCAATETVPRVNEPLDAAYWLKQAEMTPRPDNGNSALDANMDWVHVGAPTWASIATVLCRLYLAGHNADWAAVFAGTGRPARLPVYPMQRRRYWPEPMAGSFFLANAPTPPQKPTERGAVSAVLSDLQREGEISERAERAIRRQAARVLGYTEDLKILGDVPLATLGFDSDMMHELRDGLEAELHVHVPDVSMDEVGTIDAWVHHVARLSQ